jgi:hypothetical protein
MLSEVVFSGNPSEGAARLEARTRRIVENAAPMAGVALGEGAAFRQIREAPGWLAAQEPQEYERQREGDRAPQRRRPVDGLLGRSEDSTVRCRLGGGRRWGLDKRHALFHN